MIIKVVNLTYWQSYDSNYIPRQRRKRILFYPKTKEEEIG